MGGACGTHETCDKWVQNFLVRTFCQDMTLDEQGVGGKTIVINRKEAGCDDDWIQVAQDRVRWRAVASPGFNLLIPRKSGDSLATAATFSFSRTVHIR